MKRRFTSIFRYLFSCDVVLLRGLICGRDTGESLVARAPARSLTTNLGFGCCFAAATLAAVGGAHAQSTDDSLRIYAVNIIQDPPQDWTGYGIYLGKGLVITAAHVVGLAAQTKPSVRIAGMDLPAKAIKESPRVDLTLLSIDEQKLPIYLQMRRMPLCENNPWPGEPVIVAIPEGTARSHIMLPALLPADVRERFSTVIRDVATTGNSGSGVFDAGQKCLLGIMSRKITVRPTSADKVSDQKDIAKYFVPASTIRAFIPAEYRF
jgi:S1-C subfamily serine protease